MKYSKQKEEPNSGVSLYEISIDENRLKVWNTYCNILYLFTTVSIFTFVKHKFSKDKRFWCKKTHLPTVFEVPLT